MSLRYFFTVVCLLTSMPQSVWAAFPDTEASWYRTSINALEQEGVIGGYPDGMYRPHQTINRAEFLKIAMGMAGVSAIQNKEYDCFPDIEPDAWYAPYACSAKQKNITTGHADGTFKPADPVTVHEGLAFSFRALGVSIPKENNTGTWYKSIEDLSSDIGAMPDYTYNPDTQLTRGKAAALLQNVKLYALEGKRNINRLSQGCSLSESKPIATSMTVNGKERTFLLDLPNQYDHQKPYAVMLAFHGRTNNNEELRQYTKLNRNQSEFIVVYPQAIILPNKTHSWAEEENIEFIDRILAQVSDSYCIDREEVYAVGHSLGGWFTHKLTCERGDVIRAMAAVGTGGYYGECTGPAASLLLHNPEDWAVSYQSGETAYDIREDVNNCSMQSLAAMQGSFRCESAASCRSGNQTIFCDYSQTVGGGTHSWPIGATSVIQEFFSNMTLSMNP